jgi:hypothetical protein
VKSFLSPSGMSASSKRNSAAMRQDRFTFSPFWLLQLNLTSFPDPADLLFAEETHADIVLPQFYFVHHPGNENHFNI